MTGRDHGPRGRLDTDVAATRVAVRRSLGDIPAGAVVVVACSGGADSLALAAATPVRGRARPDRRRGRRRRPRPAGRSRAEVAATVADRLRTDRALSGIEPSRGRRVTVDAAGGPEAAAREARYARPGRGRRPPWSGGRAARPHPRRPGRDGAARAGPRIAALRSVAGMRRRLGRATAARSSRSVATSTPPACVASGSRSGRTRTTTTERFARVRVRTRLLPELEGELGPGVAEALARTAEAAAADTDALDAMAAQAYQTARVAADGPRTVPRSRTVPRTGPRSGWTSRR